MAVTFIVIIIAMVDIIILAERGFNTVTTAHYLRHIVVDSTLVEKGLMNNGITRIIGLNGGGVWRLLVTSINFTNIAVKDIVPELVEVIGTRRGSSELSQVVFGNVAEWW